MVTAPAAAPPDSHPLPASFAGAVPSSSQASTSFQSVYQSLPGHPADTSDAAGSEHPISKELGSKKSSAKSADDTLPAITTVSLTTDLTSQRPWAATLSTLSLALQAST